MFIIMLFISRYWYSQNIIIIMLNEISGMKCLELYFGREKIWRVCHISSLFILFKWDEFSHYFIFEGSIVQVMTSWVTRIALKCLHFNYLIITISIFVRDHSLSTFIVKGAYLLLRLAKYLLNCLRDIFDQFFIN